MKKVLFILCISFAILLFGCGNTEESVDKEEAMVEENTNASEAAAQSSSEEPVDSQPDERTTDGKDIATGFDLDSAITVKTTDIDPSIFDPDMFAREFGASVCVYECHDYDGDGTEEAFVVTGEPYDLGGYLPESLWFIAHDGTALEMMNDFHDMSLYHNDEGHYMEYVEQNKGFFYGDCGGYGSGWITFIFGMKDTKPYQLDLSMKTEGFYQEEPGIFYTLTDDFTDGHKYLITYLEYDEDAGQFIKGEITDRDWAEQFYD